MSARRDLGATAPQPSHASGSSKLLRGLRRRGLALMRMARDRKGSTLVEFGLIAPGFIAMILFLLQVTVIYSAAAVLQEGTENAARLVLTGQAKSSGMTTAASFTTALCGNAKINIFFSCSGLMVNLVDATAAPSPTTLAQDAAAPTLTFNAHGAVSNNFGYGLGAQGDIMVLQVMYQWPAYAAKLMNMSTQSNGNVLLVATVVFRNEP